MADYFNFINPLRHSLLWGAKGVLSAMGHASFYSNEYTLSLKSGEGVRMVYSCIGYGVMSFWAAFVLANKGGSRKKLLWVAFGWAVLWVINVGRVALLLLAGRKGWPAPLGWDHHAWFNIAAYAFILGMIYFYDRSHKTPDRSLQTRNANQNVQALS